MYCLVEIKWRSFCDGDVCNSYRRMNGTLLKQYSKSSKMCKILKGTENLIHCYYISEQYGPLIFGLNRQVS